MNQYLAAHGFVVLSVNYRLGIGYGRAFQHPDHGGAEGGAEYQDVLAGAQISAIAEGRRCEAHWHLGRLVWRLSHRHGAGAQFGYLQSRRRSDGVHDWSRVLQTDLGAELGLGAINGSRYEKGDLDQAMKVAFKSSPDADVARWKSPVLLIQGDDDRNVEFQQTVDLARGSRRAMCLTKS